MTGSLDDPQFRMGPLIWKAFVGLLTKPPRRRSRCSAACSAVARR